MNILVNRHEGFPKESEEMAANLVSSCVAKYGPDININVTVFNRWSAEVEREHNDLKHLPSLCVTLSVSNRAWWWYQDENGVWGYE